MLFMFYYSINPYLVYYHIKTKIDFLIILQCVKSCTLKQLYIYSSIGLDWGFNFYNNIFHFLNY